MALGESRHELDLVEWAVWIAQPAVIPGLQLELGCCRVLCTVEIGRSCNHGFFSLPLKSGGGGVTYFTNGVTSYLTEVT